MGVLLVAPGMLGTVASVSDGMARRLPRSTSLALLDFAGLAGRALSRSFACG